MFRDNPTPMQTAEKKICLVVPIARRLDDSKAIAEHYERRSAEITKNEWHVHVLLCSLEQDAELERHHEPRFQVMPATLTCISETDCPSTVKIGGPNQSPLLQLSDRVRHWLCEQRERQKFTSIEFVDHGGLGFRCIQAKRMGLEWQDVELCVGLCLPGLWLRHHEGKWTGGADELAEEYAERYSFEFADRRLIADRKMAHEMEALGWRIGGSADDHGLAINRAASKKLLVSIGVPFFNLGKYFDEALASLAAQSYEPIEVLVIDDGSTDSDSQYAFNAMQTKYPQFQFLTQENAGIGATRNRALQTARGEFFLPMDADNVAHPKMIERFVNALQRNPQLSAVSSYFLAFENERDIAENRFAYSFRPTGGPHFLSAIKNVYGDGNALFRTADLRSVGEYETERDSSWEDWEVFVKLVNAGFEVDVVPEFLFYYRHRDDSFSRETNAYQNHQRVLRRFVEHEKLPEEDRVALWNTLAGFHYRLEYLENENRALQRRLTARRYRVADWAHSWLRRVRSFLSL